MVAINLSTKILGETDIGYSTVLIGVPNIEHNVSQITMINNVVENTIKEKVGYNCQLGKMYKGYTKEDINQETNLSIILLPTDSGATPTIQTYSFSGTASAAGTITFKIFENKIIHNFVMGDTIQNIIAALVIKINNIDNFQFKATASESNLVLTALSIDSYFDTQKASITSTDSGIIIADATVNIASGVANIDDIKSILDKKCIKFSKYCVISSLELTPLFEALEQYQAIRNKDMIGRYLGFKKDTYQNLIDKSKSLNKKFITLAGLQEGALDQTEDEICGHLAGFLGMIYTSGVDISKYGLTRGDLSNASLPYDECPLTGLKINDGFEFEESELANLTNNGVWTFYNNAAGNMAMKEYTSTLYMTVDGKPSNIYKKGQVDECNNIALSYNFSVLKNNYAHKRLDETTINDVLTDLSINFDVLSNVSKDRDTGKTYYVLDARGKENFLNSIKKNIKVNYVDGSITIDDVINTVVSQLAVINMSFINKKYIGE